MAAIAESLGINTSTAADWILILLVVQIALLLLCLVTWRRISGLARKWDILLRDSGGKDISTMLESHLETAQSHDSRLRTLERQAQDLGVHLQHSVRRAGVVKYDAFPDIGGQQSFALALLDDAGNGVVLTSLVGRSESRVFAKPLKGTRATATLTGEEEAAIASAVKWD